MANRIEAAQAYVDALRTGVPALGRAVAPHLADGVVFTLGEQRIEGAQEVARRVTGVWPQTPVYRKGSWQAPREEGDRVLVHASMPPFGAGVQAVDLAFSFDAGGKITAVEQTNTNNVPTFDAPVLPEFVKARVNRALADDIPMAVSYVDENGKPSLSLRGSTMAISDTQLAIWARNRNGIVKGIAKNPYVSLLYRENPTRTTLVFKGAAHVVDDPAEAMRIHDMTPEVEINHLSRDTGAAIIIELESVDGAAPEGRVRFRRKLD